MASHNEVKKEKLETARKHMAGYVGQQAAFKEILAAMEGERCKLIDKRFWEKHFMEEHELEDWKGEKIKKSWPKYSMGAPRYQFEGGFKINLGHVAGEWSDFHVETRERVVIIEAIKKQLALLEQWQAEKAKEIANIEGCDEAALVADLLAVYKKHGRPVIWKSILDRYDVIYPKG